MKTHPFALLLLMQTTLFGSLTGCGNEHDAVGVLTGETTKNDSDTISDPGFLVGFSTRDYVHLYGWNRTLTTEQRAYRAIVDLEKAGAKWWRPHLVWNDVEPTLLYPNLRKEEVTSELVDIYLSRTNWSFYDNLIVHAQSRGINLMFVIGAGIEAPNNQLPLFQGKPINPDRIGQEAYIANCYLHARAAVRRYKQVIKWWQCENEMNTAGLQTFFPPTENKWRTGRSWWSGAFCEKVLRALNDGVKAEDPIYSHTIHNFHQLTKHTIPRWANIFDIVGYDFYPLSFIPGNIQSTDFSHELETLQQLAGAKPVLLTETGYNFNRMKGESDEKDSQDWILRSYHEALFAREAKQVNIIGYLYFTLSTAETSMNGEMMGLIGKDFVYRRGYDLIQELYGSNAEHITRTINDFESQTGFVAAEGTIAQIASPSYEGRYGLTLQIEKTATPTNTTQCIHLRQPNGSSINVSASTRIAFFIKDSGGNHPVMMTLVDSNDKSQSLWSTKNTDRHKTTVQDRWTLMSFPLSEFSGINLSAIKEIRLHFWNAGTYAIDKIMQIR